MYEVGRVCVKLAGKDAGKKVVVVENVDDAFVIIDGPVKRKRCNVKHLEALGDLLKIKKGASSEEIKNLLKVPEKKSKEKKEKPRKVRKVKEKKEVKKVKKKKVKKVKEK